MILLMGPASRPGCTFGVSCFLLHLNLDRLALLRLLLLRNVNCQHAILALAFGVRDRETVAFMVNLLQRSSISGDRPPDVLLTV